MRESEIKRSLVEYLIKHEKTDVISAEFPFHFGRRRADLICMQEDKIYGYEIKSAYDNTDRLSDQLESYEKIFDYVYVVCDKKHLNSIRSLTSKKIGIYICNSEGIKKIRKAKAIKEFDKLVTLDSMPMHHLQKEFKASGKSKLELCEKIAQKNTKKIIKKVFKKYVSQRYGEQTIIFKNEIKTAVTLDDVFSLSLPKNKLNT